MRICKRSEACQTNRSRGWARVTITEALKRTVDVTAESKEAAEQIVGDEWYSGKHILTADDFTGVEFEANTI